MNEPIKDPEVQRQWFFSVTDFDDATEYPNENGKNVGYDDTHDTPFIGTAAEAEAEATRRADLWEELNRASARRVIVSDDPVFRRRQIAVLTFDVCLMSVGSVASYIVYRAGFAYAPVAVRNVLAAICMWVGVGAFIWFLHGFTRIYSTPAERWLSLLGISLFAGIWVANISAAIWIIKRWPLPSHVQAWISWSAIGVFLIVLVLILLIVLTDPVISGIRLIVRRLRKQPVA